MQRERERAELMKGGRARALDGYIVAFGKKEEEFCSTVK